MKPIHQHFIAAALLLLCAFQGSAQTPIDVTFSPALNPVAVGATFSVQVKVVNFKNIGSIQFPITFNQNVLQLVSVTSPNAAFAFGGAPAFNTTLTLDPNGNNVFLNPGRLAVSWQSTPSAQPNGITVANNGSLFTLNFKGIADGTSAINISGPPTQPNLEVTTATGQLVTVNYQNGGASSTVGAGGNPPGNTAIYGFHVIANTIYIPAGEIGCMPFTANEFVNIQSMLYAMNWNAPTLELVATRNNGLPGSIDFGINNPLGRLATSWGTPSGNPVTKPNLSTLYEVCFRAEGAAGASTLVTPNGNGFPPGSGAEVIQGTTMPMDIWKDTTGIGDTIFIVNNPAPATAVTYTADNSTVITGQTTCVDLRLKNFTNATYGEFAITYDTSKLKFSSFNLGANPLGLSTADTATNNFVKYFAKEIINGNGDLDTIRYIHFSYKKTPGAGTIADNTSAFSMCFKAVGAASATPVPLHVSSYFDLGNALVPIGAAKKTVGSVPVAAVDGSVTITSASILSASPTIAHIVSCAGGADGAINLAVNNCNGTATYLWTGSGITNNNNTLKDLTGLTAGVYTVTVTCTVGGTATASITLSSPSALNLPAPTFTPVTCFGGSNGAISIAPIMGTAPYSYLWMGPAGFTSTNQNISNLLAGAYKVTITDANGCTLPTSPLMVTAPAPITIPTNTGLTMVNVKCKNGADGSIVLPSATGGTSPFSYAWTGPAGFTAPTQNISNLKAGAYTVVVTDSKGCTFTNPALTITEPALLSFPTPTASAVKCFNGNDGSIQINITGGSTPYSSVWKNAANGTVVDPTALAAGTYAVTVTDANLCTATSSQVLVNGPTAALVVTETHVDAACANSPTGSISLNISGGWNNGTNAGVVWNPSLPSIPNPTNILPNTYTGTVTDAGGCVVTIPVLVGSAAAISINDMAVTNVKCHGEANGGIVINPTGGGAGGVYQINWSNGLSGSPISNLAGGDYTPTVTNQATGCTAVFQAITVYEPNAIAPNETVTMQTGATDNGKIKLAVMGGTPTYTFNWTGPNGFSSTAIDSITGLAAGTYMLTITDANFCVFTKTINVSADNPIFLTATAQNACNGDGAINVTIAAGATATPFIITWNGGTPIATSDHTVSITGLAPGVYNITVTDAAGHSNVLQPQTITQLAQANVGASKVDPVGASGNGSIILSPLPANAPLQYLWSTGSTASALIQLDSGTYTVTVTNFNSGCTAVFSYHLVRQYAVVTANFSLTNLNCASSLNGAIASTIAGGNNASYQYNWSGPNGFTATTKDISGLAPGTYNLTVTDATPTPYTFSQTITAISNLHVDNVTETSLYTGGYQVSGDSICDGKATVSFSGASGAASILWSNGVTTASNTTLCGGDYQVTVTDQSGCSSVWSDNLTAPAAVDGISAIVAPVSCHGECDGIAQISATGGVAPYTVRWALPGNQFQQDPLANS
ncbi:MAG: cohesin domain-containing protein, partial [Saprospiraceae bacterium]